MNFAVGLHSSSCLTSCVDHTYRDRQCLQCRYCSCYVQVKDAIVENHHSFRDVLESTDMTRIQCNAILNEMVNHDYIQTMSTLMPGTDDFKVAYYLSGVRHN